MYLCKLIPEKRLCSVTELFRQFSDVVIWTATTPVTGVKRQQIIYTELFACNRMYICVYIYIYI